jgi:hypothetical protein
MARLAPIKNSFNAGEWSPTMAGRTDIGEYPRANRTVENWHIAPEGVLVRRSGSRFVSEVKESTAKTRIYPFVFSDEQAYVLEFGDRYIRIFRDEGFLPIPTLAGIRASVDVADIPDEFSAIGHGYLEGDGPFLISTDDTLPAGLNDADLYFVRIAHITTFLPAQVITGAADEIDVPAGHEYSDRMGPFRMTTTVTLPAGLLADTDYFIVRVSATRFGLSLSPGGGKENLTGGGTGVHTLAPTDEYQRNQFRLSVSQTGPPAPGITDGGVGLHTLTPQAPVGRVEVATRYRTADLDQLAFAQSADVLYVTHPNFPPAKLRRFSESGFWLEDVVFIDGPYLPENVTPTTLTPDGTSGAITITASTAIFLGSDVNRLVRIRAGSHWGYAQITSVNPITFQDTDIEGFNFDPVDVDVGNDQIDEAGAGHGMDTGELVRFKISSGGGTLPTPIFEDTDYYVRAVSGTLLRFYNTRADSIADTSQIDITIAGTGTGHRVTSSVIDIVGHGYTGGEGPLQATNDGGALPDGLVENVNYFVGFVDPNSLTLATSRGGTINGIDSAGGGGVHTLHGANTPQPTCEATVKSDFQAASGTAAWRLGNWSSDPERGFPRGVTFDKNRLWFTSNPGDPQTVFGSKSSDFEAMSPSGNVTATPSELDDLVNADSGISYDLGATKVNVIHWILSTRTLVAGTSSANWSDGVPLDTATTPANFKMRKSFERGSAPIVPVAVDNRTLYVSQTALKILSLGYEFEGDDYDARDLTLLASHITRSGIVAVDYSPEPWNEYHAVRADGEMANLTHIRKQQISGWGRDISGGSNVPAFDKTYAQGDVNASDDTIAETAHGLKTGTTVRFKALAGSALPTGLAENIDYFVRKVDADTLAFFTNLFNAEDDLARIDLTTTGGTAGGTFGASGHAIIESVAVIPSPTGDPSGVGRPNRAHDQKWLIVRRTINGTVRRYVEFQEDHFAQDTLPGGDVLEDAFFLDGGLTYVGTPINTITGLLHLAGERVDVLADAVVYRALVVSGTGTVTLPNGATAGKIHVGLGFRTLWESLRLSIPDAEGSGEGKLKRFDHLILRLNQSMGGSFGSDLRNQELLAELLLPEEPLLGEIPPPFTGDIEVAIDAPWETYGEVSIVQEDPLPFSLVALIAPGQQSERGQRN